MGIMPIPGMATADLPAPSFAENLRRLREERDLTQEELAFHAGIKQTAVSRYETGRAHPDLKTLLKLATGLMATGLKVSLEILVKGVDMKFDAVYEGLHVSITTGADQTSDNGRQLFGDPAPLADVMHGVPSLGGGHDPAITDLTEARAALRRAASDILSVLDVIADGSAPVARDLGPPVREGISRPRLRKSQKNPSAQTKEKHR